MSGSITSRRAFVRSLAGAGAVAVAATRMFDPAALLAKSSNPAWNRGDQVMANVDQLNLRKDPGYDGEIITPCGYGLRATVISSSPTQVDGVDWYQVDTNIGHTVGWWAGHLMADPAGTAPSDTFVVSDGPLNLRRDPYVGSQAIQTLDTGVTGVLIDPNFLPNDENLWINVRIDDDDANEGWVASEYVEFT